MNSGYYLFIVCVLGAEKSGFVISKFSTPQIT